MYYVCIHVINSVTFSTFSGATQARVFVFQQSGLCLKSGSYKQTIILANSGPWPPFISVFILLASPAMAELN